MTTVNVKQTKKVDAENAYVVQVTEDDSNEPKVYDIHTNEKGRGLWIDGRQIEGTGQFNLNVKDKAAKLRRYFQEK